MSGPNEYFKPHLARSEFLEALRIADLGFALHDRRLELGISVKQMARKLKINPEVVLSMEDDVESVPLAIVDRAVGILDHAQLQRQQICSGSSSLSTPPAQRPTLRALLPVQTVAHTIETRPVAKPV